ncbi:MAG TPA: PKD domain-containing protein [Flavisolibacter sp.]
MLKNIILIFFFFTGVAVISSCKKESYEFGEIKAPSNLSLTTEVVGKDATNPNGNGTGIVNIAATSSGALTYKIDFGNGATQTVSSGSVAYKYTTPGTNTYTITVNAIGTGGAISTTSKQVTVFVAFEIPAAMLAAFTNGTSKVWVTDKDAPGHFGVGPVDQFAPIWYAAPPNTREACAYDDEITFTKNANGTISMSINNKGTSFSTGAATGVYGFAGGDGCYNVNTGGNRLLSFSDATSSSTSAVSTRIQFAVPGNGIINFGTGGTTYEILAYTPTTLHLRNIGADGNSWYQKLKAK